MTSDKLRKDIVSPTIPRIICDQPHGGLTPKERLLLNSKRVGDCWEWQLATTPDGYGKAQINGRSWLAHRASYTLFKGTIPLGLTIDHLCQNVRCINPAHLEAVTDTTNKRRSPKVAKEYCERGHRRTPENIYVCPRGWKTCKICRAELRPRKRNELRKAETPFQIPTQANGETS